MHRVLVVIQARLDGPAAGPQIRGTELARAFAAAGHPVTIAATDPAPREHCGMPVISRGRAEVVHALRTHDAIVAPVLPPYLMSSSATRRLIRVADLYDPVDLEVGTLRGGRPARRALRRQQALRRLQLRFADVVVSANGRQHQRAVDDLRGCGRRDGGPRLVTVPMGLPAAAPAAGGRRLRARLGIAPGDPLVLWWGTPWRWLDAPTAVRAVALLSRRLPTARLVVTAGRPGDRRTDPLNATEPARAVARELGVLDRNVFFLEEWIPYDERAAYLQDADIGLTLHAAGPESPLAARARYMDYIWAGLPSVLAAGDELADAMAAAGAAWLVPAGDTAAVAGALERLLGDPQALAAARDGSRSLARALSWPAVTAPLVAAVAAATPRRLTARGSWQVARASGGFYARRGLGVG